MTVLTVMLAGCDFRAATDDPAAATSAPPTPTPAVTEAEAKKIIARYASVMNLAGKRLSGTVAARAETGSALEIRKAQYKIFKVNKLTTYTYKFTSAVGASPKFSAYPRWFLLALVDRGTGTRVRNLIIFVQGSSRVRSWYRGLERQELVAYVPPRGKGKIQIIAGSWSPVTLRGK